MRKYKIYPTLLDSFYNYLDSDSTWEKFWGWSDNPPHTMEEFRENQFKELIDRINRVPFDSEAADKGTCFNEIVDCIVENRKSKKMDIERVLDDNGVLTHLKATYNDRSFSFPIGLCMEFSDYFKGALTQQYVECTMNTGLGEVLLYGFIDELMPLSVHDIKTTGSYSVGKFKNHHQHLVYPCALYFSGSDVRTFEYNIAELKGDKVLGTYTETYVFNPDRDIPVLQEHCNKFIVFLEENRDLITDKKIFGII